MQEPGVSSLVSVRMQGSEVDEPEESDGKAALDLAPDGDQVFVPAV